MCWNPDISINTFLFACLALLFIFLTNFYSKYKLKAFNNPIIYLLLLEASTVQLIEYFLWRNLKNISINEMLSKLISFLIFIQPPTLMLMVPNLQIKYILLISYFIFMVFYFILKDIYSPIKFHTSVGKNGHLRWEWINNKGYINKILLSISIFFYAISFLFINNIEITLIGLVTLFITLFIYFKDNTFGSMWCWVYNIFLLYFIINILIIKPFYEYNGLC